MKIVHAMQALTPDGWRDDVTVRINPSGYIESIATQASDTADHRTDLLLPAPVNLHSHAFQRAMTGLTETRGPDPADSFWTWRRLMYRFLDRLTPQDVQAIAAQVFMEMAEAGYAAVAEFHYLHHAPGGRPYDNIAEMSERIVAAATQTGLGLTLLPVFYQFSGCGGGALSDGQRRFGNDVDRFMDLHASANELISTARADYAMGVAPHSLRAVDAEGLAAVAALNPDRPVHMHLAEQVAEVDQVLAHYGARPVEWLINTHELSDRWCLIHCTQMTADETTRLAATGSVAGLCPITESNLGDGIFNATAFLEAGGTLGFGSDSNVHIALFEELRVLEYSQRLRDRSRAALATSARSTGRVLYDAALVGGAKAAGRLSGALAPGYQADLLGIATHNPWICDRKGDVALDSLIFGGHGQSCITDVWSAGHYIVQNGRHIHRAMILEQFIATMTALGQDI